jgi:hypothetical protein
MDCIAALARKAEGASLFLASRASRRPSSPWRARAGVSLPIWEETAVGHRLALADSHQMEVGNGVMLGNGEMVGLLVRPGEQSSQVERRKRGH